MKHIKNYMARIYKKPCRTIYINRKDCYGNLETVDEFTEGRKYVIEMLKEYRLCEPSAHYYMSQKSCKNWEVEA